MSALSTVVFSSSSDDWTTPQPLIDHLNASFQFTLDPCATPASAKAPKFFTQADDGLAQSWAGERVFMNPPYSTVGQWVQKAYEESRRGATVVCLVAARTDTRWWQAYVRDKANEVEFLPGRVSFGRGDDHVPNTAPFPSALIIYRPLITRELLRPRKKVN